MLLVGERWHLSASVFSDGNFVVESGFVRAASHSSSNLQLGWVGSNGVVSDGKRTQPCDGRQFSIETRLSDSINEVSKLKPNYIRRPDKTGRCSIE